MACFLDISGAYDNVKIDLLIQKLVKLGVPLKLSRFLWELLKQKEMHFYYENEMKLVRTGYQGLPQGSVLSPFLYNIYTYGIERIIEPECSILQYADDVSIYYSSKHVEVSKRKIQDSLLKLNDWFSELGLNLNCSKTQCILFSRKHRTSNWELSLQGNVLPKSETVKYLGLTFQRKMNWNGHIKETVAKCRKRINFLRCLCGVSWGAHPDTLLVLYKSFIRPVFEYGCASFAQLTKTQLIKIERIQWSALRICFGLMKSTHTGTLEVLSGVPPVSTRYKLLNFRYIVKLMFTPNNILLEKLRRLKLTTDNMKVLPIYDDVKALIGEVQAEEIYRFDLEALYFKPLINDSVRREMKSKELCNETIANQLFLASIEQYDVNNVIYTDGSRQQNLAGIGIFQPPETHIKFRIYEPNTIYTCELTAIYKAALHIETLHPSKFIIVTDSLSSIEALRSVKTPHKSNVRLIDCRNVLHRLAKKNFDISLMWVPSHMGIRGNEQAEISANEAINADYINLSTVSSDYRFLAKIYCTTDWQLQWSSGEHGRFTHSIFPKVTWQHWAKELKEDRRFIVNISRIAANHYRLGSHLQRINIINNAVCACGKEFETVNHILWNCHLFQRQRMKLLQTKFQHLLGIDIRDIIGCRQYEFCKEIVEFLLDCNVNL